MTKSPLIATLAFLAASLSSQAQTFTYDFDTSQADFNSNFAATGSGEWSTASVPGWTATGGVDNTGRIQAGGNNNTAVLLTASDFSSVGSSNTVSTWFEARLNGDGEISGFANLGVGFTTDTTGTLASGQYFAAEIATGGNATDGDSFLAWRGRESGTIGGTDVDAFSLTDGNWYELETTLTKLATSGEFSININLTDYGADGTSSASLIDTYSVGTISGLTTLWNDSELNAAFQGYSQGGTGGAYGFDNFEATVVPEPSAFFLLSLAVLFLAVRHRRAS